MRTNTGLPPFPYGRILADTTGVHPKEGWSDFLRLTGGTYKTVIIYNVSGELIITTVGAGTAVAKITTTIDTLEFYSATAYIQSANVGTKTLISNFDIIRPSAGNSKVLGTAVYYWLEVHAATGGFVEHSPRKFSKPSRELILSISRDSEDNILVPEELRQSDGTSIGHLAYVAADALREVLLELHSLRRRIQALEVV